MVFELLGFFIFFELTLIPIYLIILIYGSRERKIRASYLISLYTLFGSIFMFFNILYCFSKFGTTNFHVLLSLDFSPEDSKFL
jgi:NADH-ubiquinone oxidoreductase chain 4